MQPGHGNRGIRVPVEVFVIRYNFFFLPETLLIKNKQKQQSFFPLWRLVVVVDGKTEYHLSSSRDYGPNRAAIYYRTRTHARKYTHKHTNEPVIAAHIYRFS